MAISDCPTMNQLPRILVIACIALSSGCVSVSSLQDWNYRRVQKSRATVAWNEQYDAECRHSLGSDFKGGYKAGFVDASMGKTCDLPPVPPPKYWSASYQSADAQVCIQDWYRGYQSGQTAALSRGLPGFHAVPVSPTAPVLNKTACGLCYGPDRCECNNSAPIGNAVPLSMPHDASAWSPSDASAQAIYETNFPTEELSEAERTTSRRTVDAPPVPSDSRQSAAKVLITAESGATTPGLLETATVPPAGANP